jgi:hypothetical protein
VRTIAVVLLLLLAGCRTPHEPHAALASAARRTARAWHAAREIALDRWEHRAPAAVRAARDLLTERHRPLPAQPLGTRALALVR